jgi:hypothetical protein
MLGRSLRRTVEVMQGINPAFRGNNFANLLHTIGGCLAAGLAYPDDADLLHKLIDRGLEDCETKDLLRDALRHMEPLL